MPHNYFPLERNDDNSDRFIDRWALLGNNDDVDVDADEDRKG